jgi:dTDP-4-amino-4,6-dideoxy-D-galactose acyltransferase|tara:strand:- start:564 stop:1280 length:717 start_codon:yes stop_codon:yes gene_type:complete
MIKELEWDTGFFKKKIGTLIFDEVSGAILSKDLEEAKIDQYKYIVCQLKSPELSTINLLEAHKFYLSDVGVTWEMEVEEYISRIEKKRLSSNAKAIKAGSMDISGLQEMIKPMFPNSRFYSDPFFSHAEADNLHVVWIENSVLGKAADVVLQIPGKGFVTCKKREDEVGEIILIGVKDRFRGKTLGKVLMDSSVEWFSDNGIKNIKIKTQLKNVAAMNFYRKLGFSIDGYDMTFSYVM